jgi:hypothetical protein
MARTQQQQFSTIRTEGALLPPDVLQQIASGKAEGLRPADYHLPEGYKLNEAITQSWDLLKKHWKTFQEARAALSETDTGTEITNKHWLLPLFRELDYGHLATSPAPQIEDRSYPIERFYNHTPIHLVGCNLPLDRRTKGARGAATASPHSMVQEFLNRSEGHVWAIGTNGLRLRLLRDNVALSRQAFVEFDLEAMMEGEVYPDFALLWLLLHQSRVEAAKPDDCWLEAWSKLARESGTRILKQLRESVRTAIEALGQGFVSHVRNDALREKLRSGTLSRDDYYRQLLRIVYRLLFLFVAEDRDLLHVPATSDTTRDHYRRFYSLSRLRDMALKLRGSKHGDLWHGLSLVFQALGSSDGCQTLGLTGLGSFLWTPAKTPDLNGPHEAADGRTAVEISNDDLLSAIRALAYVEQDGILRSVDYRNLGSEELGSVYESLLELHPDIEIDAQRFSLATAAGNQRKTSGSYYTPDSLVQCLLDSTLDPVVEDRIKGKKGADAEAAILDLTVCDPACGSGHFLIAAAHRLARHVARIRTGESEPSPDDHQTALRDVISRCIYGVDLNPMAVELCKVSLWMEAIEPGKPLSFLDHHIKCGNSLLGVTPRLLREGIPEDAFKAIEGDDKDVVKDLKKRHKQELKDRTGGVQSYLFTPYLKLGNLGEEFVRVTTDPTDTAADVARKASLYADLVERADYLNAKLLADTWCSAFVWKKDKTELGKACPTERDFRECETNPHSLLPHVRTEVARLADEFSFFHWHLAFPAVFHVPLEDHEPDNDEIGCCGGFDIILGNPPYLRIQNVSAGEAKFLYATYSAATSKVDLSLLFMQLCVRLVSLQARAGLVCPSQWLFTDYGSNLRAYFAEGHVLRMVDLGSLPVFEDADTYAAAFTLSRAKVQCLELITVTRIEDVVPAAIRDIPPTVLPFSEFDESPWRIRSPDTAQRLSHSTIACSMLGAFADVCIGALTGQDKAFVVDADAIELEEIEESILIPYAYRGGEVEPFRHTQPHASIIFPYREGGGGSPVVIPEQALKHDFPNAYRHLKRFEDTLRQRKDSRKLYAAGEDWYRFLRPGNFRYITPRKVLIKGIETFCAAGLLSGRTAFNGANCPGLVLKPEYDTEQWLFFFLGLLNTDATTSYLRSVCPPKLGGYFRFNATNLARLPVPETLATTSGLTPSGAHVSALAQAMAQAEEFDCTELNELVASCYDAAQHEPHGHSERAGVKVIP